MKTAETNPVYQSTILPIMQKAETKIKTLILVAFLYGQPKAALLAAIMAVVKKVKDDIPAEFGDSSAYVNGLISSANKMVEVGYIAPQTAFFRAKADIISSAPAERRVFINNPKELNDFISKPGDMWAEAKGSPNVVWYEKELKQTINRLSEMPTVTQEEGKKPITIWQKAELDTRYENQMQKLQNLRTMGEDLCYISSHPDCSKRCQQWQGKLVSLSEKSTMSGFRVKKIDGKWVYSLVDIMAQVDKYGYHNNIICGFNCRHRLIPYRKQLPPTAYSDKDVAKERDIETSIRERERKIRLLKTKQRLYNESGIKNPTVKVKMGKKMVNVSLKEHIKKTEQAYKTFCERNGYAWQEYRIKI